MIKVLHIANTYIAGAPINIVKCLNKYSDKVKARLLTMNDFGNNPRLGKLQYDTDMMYGRVNVNELQKAFDESAVIHLHNPNIHQKVIPNRNIENKKIVLHLHNWAYKPIKDRRYDMQVVVGQYQPRLFPEAYIVPNVIDIYNPMLMPYPIKNEIPKVFYSYSNSSEKEGTWNDKGSRYVIQILKTLENQGHIKTEIHTNTPYKKLMSIKSKCDICIDDIMTGSFHLTSLEALSMGLILINRIDELTKKVLYYLTDNRLKLYQFSPANKDNLEYTIMEELTDDGYFDLGKKDNRSFMENYWNPKKMIAYYEDIYKSVVSNTNPKICKKFSAL